MCSQAHPDFVVPGLRDCCSPKSSLTDLLKVLLFIKNVPWHGQLPCRETKGQAHALLSACVTFQSALLPMRKDHASQGGSIDWVRLNVASKRLLLCLDWRVPWTPCTEGRLRQLAASSMDVAQAGAAQCATWAHRSCIMTAAFSSRLMFMPCSATHCSMRSRRASLLSIATQPRRACPVTGHTWEPAAMHRSSQHKTSACKVCWLAPACVDSPVHLRVSAAVENITWQGFIQREESRQYRGEAHVYASRPGRWCG